MSYQHVPIPPPMKPILGISRFLFRSGKGDWVYKLIGAAAAMESRVGGPNTFKDYIPTKNDVIITSPARSGTHWIMQIALQIAHLGKAEYDYLYDHVAWPDFLPGVSIKLTDPPPASPTGLRIIKSHSPAHSVTVNDEAKYISVIRDPKEVLVSLYYFAPQAFAFMGIQTGTPENWLQKFLKNQIPGGWWAGHTASWWALRSRPNVHVITFNDLKSDSAAEIDRISAFLGVELTPEQCRRVNEKSSFEYMKAIDHKFSPIIGNTEMPVVVRNGKTGSGRELFTPEQLARIDSFCKRELDRLGSDFPYDALFG